MRHGIVECLDFGIGDPCLLEVFTERVLDFLNAEDDIQKVREEVENTVKRKSKVPDLPLQDTVWSCTEIALTHHDLSRLRMLVLSDTRTSGSSTIQFSLEQASQISHQHQALQLLYLGCLHPLDGRRSRRPRFLCRNIPCDDNDRNTFQTECDKLGIHFCGAYSSKEELNTLREQFNHTAYFRECSVCGISGTPLLFNECGKCGAVLYCGKKCEMDDWEESHQDWCSRFKDFMAAETELAKLPFDFSSETTELDFHELKRKEFLDNFKIYAKDRSYGNCPVFGLGEESSVLESCPPSRDRPLNGWKDYYSLRGFHQQSPIAVLLHFPLTLYYIIDQLLPKDFHETFDTIQQSNHICIHVIGAEKEVEMFYLFLECARLLTPLTLDIHLFGINFDAGEHGEKLEKENLRFQIHKGLYHRINHEHIPLPSLAVCFNGGIGAYTSYIKTVKLLMKNKTPLYYTDYGQACIALSTNSITNSKAGDVSPPLINPFRCPLRLVASDQNLPRYSNAFITHIKPFSFSSRYS